MIEESSLELQDHHHNNTRAAGGKHNNNTKFFNNSCYVESKQTRAYSPKLKKNLLINLPTPAYQ